MNLNIFRAYGEDEIADRLLAILQEVIGISRGQAKDWPAVPCVAVVDRWTRTREEVLVPYFEARAAHAGMTPINRESAPIVPFLAGAIQPTTTRRESPTMVAPASDEQDGGKNYKVDRHG